ncbi:adenylyltransferase/cytidyltransferase family protein [Candidatus Parcubacteria bacterium]|nr:adenylyltransferase/cytidyltransferase family protein [Candidatus Parcubacteria bacterium]
MNIDKDFKFSFETKVVSDYDKLQQIVTGHKAQGKIIIAVSGVFDMIHDGHVKYLEKASQLGDILILGVDDDELTRKNKGEGRPFDELESRLAVLGGLSCVDHIKVRDVKEGVGDFVTKIEPDVLVISSSSTQYDEDKETFSQIIDRMYVKTGIAKKVVNFEPQSSNSTTAKILKLKKEGAKPLIDELSEVILRHTGESKQEKKKS